MQRTITSTILKQIKYFEPGELGTKKNINLACLLIYRVSTISKIMLFLAISVELSLFG